MPTPRTTPTTEQAELDKTNVKRLEDDKRSSAEIHAAELAKIAPRCPHVWNHLPGMTLCRICRDERMKENALRQQQFALQRGFHRTLNPIISADTIKAWELERNRIVIAFRAAGKRGKTYVISFTPNHSDIGGVYLEVGEGSTLVDQKVIASGIIGTADFAAIGALITNPEIIPKAPAAGEEVKLDDLYPELKGKEP